MLPYNNRLPYLDFLYTKQNGKLLKFGFGTVIFIKKPNSSNSRFLIKVSAKTTKLSTKRNRIKRITREALKNISIKLTTNIDATISVKKVMDKMKTQDIQQILEQVFQKERILKS